MRTEIKIGIFAAVLVVAFIGLFCFAESHSDDEAKFTYPVIHIDVENGEKILSKEHYLDCSVTIDNTDSTYCLNDESARIRGRGNTTWSDEFFDMPKKPYRLKFDVPVDLFGEGAAQDWALIANYNDPTMCRNLFAYSIGDLVGVKFDAAVHPVQLYLNGHYEGLYMLTEQMEVGEHRVDIEQSFPLIDTGYLIEMDLRAPRFGT